MRAYPFAALISQIDGAPFASHLPFLLDKERGELGTLQAHMARPNPHWRGFSERVEALVVFQGPHAYVSPSWYATQPAVPTWNYVAVHAYGIARCVDDAELRWILHATVDTFEPPGSGYALADDYFEKLAHGVVGFEIEITRLEGKFKLNQNRSAEDQQRVVEALAASPRSDDQQTAAFMEARIFADGTRSVPATIDRTTEQN
jgi:transcriptional regulator